MIVKYMCSKCETELTTTDVSPGYAFRCPKCNRSIPRWKALERYFPSRKGYRVFAVDTYVTLCKCMKVEALSREGAEDIAQSEIVDGVFCHDDACAIKTMADLGFQDAEEMEFKASGEANENGEIEYY